MDQASEAERNKPSRPYDGMAQFSEHHKQLAAQLLTTAVPKIDGVREFIAFGFGVAEEALEKRELQVLKFLRGGHGDSAVSGYSLFL